MTLRSAATPKGSKRTLLRPTSQSIDSLLIFPQTSFIRRLLFICRKYMEKGNVKFCSSVNISATALICFCLNDFMHTWRCCLSPHEHEQKAKWMVGLSITSTNQLVYPPHFPTTNPENSYFYPTRRKWSHMTLKRFQIWNFCRSRKLNFDVRS